MLRSDASLHTLPNSMPYAPLHTLDCPRRCKMHVPYQCRTQLHFAPTEEPTITASYMQVLLVGGFAASPYLQRRAKVELGALLTAEPRPGYAEVVAAALAGGSTKAARLLIPAQPAAAVVVGEALGAWPALRRCWPTAKPSSRQVY